MYYYILSDNSHKKRISTNFIRIIKIYEIDPEVKYLKF